MSPSCRVNHSCNFALWFRPRFTFDRFVLRTRSWLTKTGAELSRLQLQMKLSLKGVFSSSDFDFMFDGAVLLILGIFNSGDPCESPPGWIGQRVPNQFLSLLKPILWQRENCRYTNQQSETSQIASEALNQSSEDRQVSHYTREPSKRSLVSYSSREFR